MASVPQTVTLQPVRRGDTWDGINIYHRTAGVALSAPLARVRMFWRRANTSAIALQLDSDDPSQIDILDADAWTIQIQPIPELDLPEGLYEWSITANDDLARRKTRIAGTILILNHPGVPALVPFP